MRRKVYSALVNRHAGISARYHAAHDHARGVRKVVSWLYLLWLNFAYYILFMHFLGRKPGVAMYESKRLLLEESESSRYLTEHSQLSVEAFVSACEGVATVSFDVFDTLVLRAVSQPSDVFYFVGDQLGIPNFRVLRMEAERRVRARRKKVDGHYEVTFEEIWKELSLEIGCGAARGMQLEIAAEKNLCYANPFMLQVWKRLLAQGKRIIVVSDMYLPSAVIRELIEGVGFFGAEKIFVSCEYAKNKATGSLFAVVKEYLQQEACGEDGSANASAIGKVIHIGDNPRSDDEMARRAGLSTMPYQNVNKNMLLFRPYDMSYLVGSAYRGIVSGHLYSGLNAYSRAYEYGYLYGGLFVLGYCQFIHAYCAANAVDKVLFLSRDGDILKKVYDRLYPQDETVYAYWSRKAATKLAACFDVQDYFRRFLFHKVNQGYSIAQILSSMELLAWVRGDVRRGHAKHLFESAEQAWHTWYQMHSELEMQYVELHEEDLLTDKNVWILRALLEVHWEEVLAEYEDQHTAAKQYYEKLLDGCRRAVAVDIGWAGSGALVLRKLFADVWKLPCELTGMVAGTNTVHNVEADASEAFLQSGVLVSYMYSQSHNRDLLKLHDPNKNYNVFWELLLSSDTPKFQGFYLDMEGEVQLDFGACDANAEGIREIQRGIQDFVWQYTERFAAYPYMMRISGRDAYAPMVVASSHKEKYLKEIEKLFQLEIQVD